jgi:putative transposase
VTDTIDLTSRDVAAGGSEPGRPSLEQLAVQSMDRARDEGVSLVGPGGLLAGLTNSVLESALDGELTEHLGYEPYEPVGHHSGRSRKRDAQEDGADQDRPIELGVSRDRAGTFEPVIVPKRRRRLSGVDVLVCSLSAKGLAHGEICAHLAQIYGAVVSNQTISRITDRVLKDMSDWQNRPVDPA